MGITAVIFDLDGTLVDSAESICDAAAAAIVELGGRASAADIAPHLGAPLSELYAEFVGTDDARLPHFVERYIALHDAHPAKDPPPLPGVAAGLRELSALPLGIATTKPSDRARAQLESSALISHFAHVQGTDDGMSPKPDPDVLLAACRGLGVRPHEVVMVGDTQRDVDAARAVGAIAIAIAYDDEGLARAGGFGADHVVSTIEGLSRLIP